MTPAQERRHVAAIERQLTAAQAEAAREGALDRLFREPERETENESGTLGCERCTSTALGEPVSGDGNRRTRNGSMYAHIWAGCLIEDTARVLREVSSARSSCTERTRTAQGV